MSKVLALVLLFLTSSSLPSASAAPTVRTVRVEGNARLPSATILHHLALAGLRAGATLDAAAVRAGLERLQSLGLFETVSIDSQEPDGRGALNQPGVDFYRRLCEGLLHPASTSGGSD